MGGEKCSKKGVCPKESYSAEGIKSIDRTFVIFKSLIHVSGVKKIVSKTDGLKLTITTDEGEVEIEEPGNYIITRSEHKPHPMTEEQVTKYKTNLTERELKKLE